LVAADYTGAISATYEYQYDPVGNRTAYTTTITSTEVITYLYDNANRLVETVVIGGDTTTYTWDNASRLITTTVAGQVSRVYQYSQDGDLITATVDSLVTAFAYDGDGRRLLMSVAGEVTTYTLDYAFFGTRILFEDGPDDNKHYLYGVQCIAEVVDEGTAEEEWRYYQRDGNHMVRQTTNETAEVTLAWTYTPEGIVLVGEEGPVTYLDCGSGGIYDWSTGLIFKDGRFFDPSTGIWITLSGVVVYYHVGQARGRKRKFGKGKKRRVLLLLLLVLVALALAGCDSPEPECPTSTPETLPLDGYAYFSDSLPGQTTKPWKPDEKETVKTDLNNAVNVIAGANGFGSRDNLFMEIGIDKENPIILIRQEAGRFPITRLRANNPLMFVYDAYIENPDPNLGPSLFGHELAHFWDQNKNREPSSSMIDWKNWGAAATDIAAGDDLEDFAEAFRIYFWPRYDQGKEWTDDFGAGMRNHRIGVIEEPDSLYLDPNDPSKPPTTTPTELRVQDRYDWFQNEFTGTW
jgi:YD repeat-containing protein